jgi:hypothetical protein
MFNNARLLQQKKQLAKLDSTDGFFKPRIKHTKEVCKQNVRRLIDVLDMRLSKNKRVVENENVSLVNYDEYRVIENKVPYELKRNHYKFY